MPQISVQSPVTCPARQPVRWPFPPRKPGIPRSTQGVAVLRQPARKRTAPQNEMSSVERAAISSVTWSSASHAQGMTPKAMLMDVCAVLAWALAIPGTMWLGAIAGF